MMAVRVDLAFIIALAAVSVVQPAKIALVPFPAPSHVSQLSHIGKELQKDGHELFLILPTSYPALAKMKGGPFQVLTTKAVERDLFGYDLSEHFKAVMGKNPLDALYDPGPGTQEGCRNYLSDKEFNEELKSLDIDLFIMDGLPIFHCLFVLPYRLGKPYVTFVTTAATFWYRNPTLPSTYPFPYGKPYTEKMTFIERLDNVYSMILMASFVAPSYNSLDWIGKYAPERPSVSIDDLLRNSSLWLVDTDVTVDYPRPVMPNEILVGGVTTQPAAPLPPDFEITVKSAEHGVIIMSFGSFLPDVNSERFMKVFSRLKQVVLWRHTSEYKGDTPVPPNVHLVKWLPQADLLGHKNTKLFITHCGANGQFEALYHGVPMLGFPAFAEQSYNAKRMAYHGFGQVMDIFGFTEDELYEAINDMLQTPSYQRNIELASRIYRDQPMRPLERISFWINHVIKYGSRHLQSYALEMPWYSYIMLDIFEFVLIVSLALIALLLYIGCFIKRKLSGGKKRKSD